MRHSSRIRRGLSAKKNIGGFRFPGNWHSRTRRSRRLALFCVSCLSFQLASADLLASSLPPGFVKLADVAPKIRQEIRYAGANNFTGRPVPGYAVAECWLRKEAASALAEVEAALVKRGLSLVVYDCYRPQRATNAFIEWAADEKDQVNKARFYPSIEKRTLFAMGYISARSSHSTGLSVDLAIDGLDFGTPFDFFDSRSKTASLLVRKAAQENRRRLRDIMVRYGFSNYEREWWHFTYKTWVNLVPLDVEVK